MTTGTPKYTQSQRIRHALEEGRNIVHLVLQASDLTGALRLDPGSVPGDYVIDAIEVVEVPLRTLPAGSTPLAGAQGAEVPAGEPLSIPELDAETAEQLKALGYMN